MYQRRRWNIFWENNDLVISHDASYSEMESTILILINEYRKSLNLAELECLNVISNVATTHTHYMVDVGVLSHDNFAIRAQSLIENAAAKSVGEKCRVWLWYSTRCGKWLVK